MIDNTLLLDLEQCLQTIVAEEAHLNANELRGLFYAQMITPQANQPLVWVSALFYGERPAMTDTQITALNIALAPALEAYSALWTANKLHFPFDFEKLDEAMAEAAYEWCNGFLIGLLINEIFWFGKKGEVLTHKKSELATIRNSARLFYGLINKDFTAFDRVKIAELTVLLQEQGQDTSDDMLAIALFPSVPMAVKTLQLYGSKKIRENAPAQPIINTVKQGRNDACQCGSGKKYKKCCGQ